MCARTTPSRSRDPIAASPARRGRGRARRICLLLVALLYVASVPWYRTGGAPLRVWLGLPDWVTFALLCYVAVAILNAFAWHWTDVRDDDEHVSEDGA